MWLVLMRGDDGRGAVREPSRSEASSATARPASAKSAPAASRAAAWAETPEEGDPEADEPPDRPPVRHAPGAGPIAPVDLTNLAPARLGLDRWVRLAGDGVAWRELWIALHEEDARYRNPLDEPTGPPQMLEGEEAVLVVGLGARPRMDYAVLLEAVATKFGELRYRLEVRELPDAPVEVPTRPARAWLVPVAPMRKLGLVLEDERGFEIARFEAPASRPADEER